MISCSPQGCAIVCQNICVWVPAMPSRLILCSPFPSPRAGFPAFQLTPSHRAGSEQAPMAVSLPGPLAPGFGRWFSPPLLFMVSLLQILPCFCVKDAFFELWLINCMLAHLSDCPHSDSHVSSLPMSLYLATRLIKKRFRNTNY